MQEQGPRIHLKSLLGDCLAWPMTSIPPAGPGGGQQLVTLWPAPDVLAIFFSSLPPHPPILLTRLFNLTEIILSLLMSWL